VFAGIGNLIETMKHLPRIQSELGRVSRELQSVVVEGSAGGGLVKVRMSGILELVECKIDPAVFDDRDTESLEEMVRAAINQASERARRAAAERFGQAVGGLNIPGVEQMVGLLSGGTPGS
jgi:hypothetical protein